MGFDIKITGSDGRRYSSLSDMIQAEGERLVADHTQAVQRAIESTRCPTHGQRARAAMSKTSEGYSFDISGCCDDLIRRAQAAASRASS